MRLYTKTGDDGETALFDGARVSKTDARVAAYGDIDELNATIGLALATGLDPDVSEVLVQIQRDLFAVGSLLADPRARIADRVTKTALGAEDVERLELAIDRFDVEVPPLRRFLLPGGGPGASALHLARGVCRRAERGIVGLGTSNVPPELLQYVNRLSDLLFALARVANHRTGVAEREW